MVEEATLASIRGYIGDLHGMGIRVSKVVLFGSFARDQADKYSDIDLVVIAPEFDNGHEISLVKKLWKATKRDNRIEPVACGEREWESDESRPIVEIARREGIVIAA